ncbi:MAG TPA: BTAD domain-containing putative transcriptional regulator [Actinomycetes bacterium]
MEIRLLGPLEVSSQGRPVEVAGRRLRLLLAVLALQAGQVVAAERLVDLLWPPAGLPADPVNALQALVSRLRRALEPPGAGERMGPAPQKPAAASAAVALPAGQPVVARAPGYLLAVEPDQVDALRFERLAAAGHAALAAGRHREAAAALRGGLALWRGPALADFAGEPFAAGTATRLEELRLGAVEDRCDADLALGEHARLVGELEALVAEHPLRERLHALLMRALYGAGRQAEALAAYQRARQVLADQAGLDPGPELRQVEQAVLAQDPSLSAPAGTGADAQPAGARAGDGAGPPPAAGHGDRAAGARPGRANLPMQLTSFVGREAELGEVLELLGRHRMVTLTGPGGVGKTRLALEAARRLGYGAAADLAPEGSWVVELGGLRDGGLLPQLVLDALGLGEERPRFDAPAAPSAAADRLLAALRSRRALLLLDNCEHLAEAAADLAGRLLAACAGVRVLATSREPLRIPGEARWPVPTLPVPPPGPVDAGELPRFAATRLFLERAATAVPGYHVREGDDADAVAEVCRRLDGLPLAIELAAARVAALPPRELAARLHDRFRLLTAGARTALPRQQTLRAVVEWSWELLDRQERAALRRLAVFSGGCTLDAAEAVCAGKDLPAEEVAGTVARLVDKSLLAAGPAPAPPAPWWPGIEALGLPPQPMPATPGPRYRMLETVQAYAALRLAEAGEADQAARAHARWCAGLAEAAEPELRDHRQLAAFARLITELDNLRAALLWTTRHGEAALAVRVVAPLGSFLMLIGHREEAHRWLRAALALPGPVPDRARGLALFALVWAEQATAGRRAAADLADQAQEALERAAASDGERVLARVLATTIRLFSGSGDDAERALERSMEEVDRVGGWPAAYVRLMRGFARITRGDPEGQRKDGEECLARFREVGDRWGVVQAQELLSALDLQEGRYAEATARLQEGLRNAWELRLTSELAVQLCRLAHAAVLAGDLDQAESWLLQALAAGHELGGATETAFAHAGLGLVAQCRGDAERARREHDQALASFDERNRRHPLGSILMRWIGTVAEQQGDLARAAASYREVVEQARAHASPPLLALALGALASVACAAGDPERAAVLLGAATAAIRSARLLLPADQRAEIDHAAEAARRALGEDRFAAAVARGEALPFEDVIALAEQD